MEGVVRGEKYRNAYSMSIGFSVSNKKRSSGEQRGHCLQREYQRSLSRNELSPQNNPSGGKSEPIEGKFGVFESIEQKSTRRSSVLNHFYFSFPHLQGGLFHLCCFVSSWHSRTFGTLALDTRKQKPFVELLLIDQNPWPQTLISGEYLTNIYILIYFVYFAFELKISDFKNAPERLKNSGPTRGATKKKCHFFTKKQ